MLRLVHTEATAAPSALPLAERMIEALRRRVATTPHPAEGACAQAMVEAAFALWQGPLRHFPGDPDWPDRDRVVIAGAGAAALAQALLQLSGYEAPAAEALRIGRSRGPRPCRLAHAWSSARGGRVPRALRTVTPARPDEALALAVGMASAGHALAATFDGRASGLIDHRCYALVDRSCLAGTVARDACRLAARDRLDRIVVIFAEEDGIGDASKNEADPSSFFSACGWTVLGPLDTRDRDALDAALREATTDARGPVAIVMRRPNSAAAGSQSQPDMPAEIPDGDSQVRAAWDARARGGALHRDWQRRLAQWSRAHPARAAEFDRRLRHDVPTGHVVASAMLVARAARLREPASTRSATHETLAALAVHWPELHTLPAGSAVALAGGAALHGGVLAHASLAGRDDGLDDGLVEALRRAARQRSRLLLVLDGETDDTTPIGDLETWRPCDATEAIVAAVTAVGRRGGPVILRVGDARQQPHARSAAQVLAIARGAYVLAEQADPAAVLLASGGAVGDAIEAHRRLAAHGLATRVVSMPSAVTFDRQDATWREHVLPASLPVLRVESGVAVDALLATLLDEPPAMRAA